MSGRLIPLRRHLSGAALLLAVALAAAPGAAEADSLGPAGKAQTADPWGAYRFLEGSWSGAIGGALGTGTGAREYEFVVDGVYLMSRHRSQRPPQPESPTGDAHVEIGIFSFDRAEQRVVYRQFVNEGFVNRYACRPLADREGFSCATEAVESGPGMRARWVVTPLAPDSFAETFELAGAGEELSLLFENHWTRVRREPHAAAAAAARESLRAAEVAFAATVAARDREAFAAFLDPAAVFVGSEVLRGSSAIVEAWSGFFAADGPRLEWQPEVVEVLESGTLGLTRGPYRLIRSGADGEPETVTGIFSSIWRRRPDGAWRIVFDSGCPPG